MISNVNQNGIWVHTSDGSLLSPGTIYYTTSYYAAHVKFQGIYEHSKNINKSSLVYIIRFRIFVKQ